MLRLFRPQTASETDRPRPASKPPLPVGWLLDGEQHPGFVYEGPRPVSGPGLEGSDPEAIPAYPQAGAAVSRYFELPCPFELRLQPLRDREGRWGLVNKADRAATVDPRRLQTFAVLMEQDLWRHPERPIVQVVTPYRFIADETLWMTQLPAFGCYRDPPWPGVLIGGRLPIHIWPRLMSWAFEWHDPRQDLVLRAGDPWYYVKFEPADPTRQIRMVEAEMTPELRKFCTGLDGVIHYANRTFSYFETASRRRPEVLLKVARR